MPRQSLFNSFKNAFRGLAVAVRTQRNIRIHLLATLLVTAAGVYLHITRLEWAALFISIGLVLALELINTALEVTLDHLHPELHPKIGMAKDIAAAAVVIAAIMAVAVAFAVFYVRIKAL